MQVPCPTASSRRDSVIAATPFYLWTLAMTSPSKSARRRRSPKMCARRLTCAPRCWNCAKGSAMNFLLPEARLGNGRASVTRPSRVPPNRPTASFGCERLACKRICSRSSSAVIPPSARTHGFVPSRRPERQSVPARRAV